MYYLTRKIVLGLVCHILYRVKYENEEVIKKFDKCLICPNHSRIYDPIFIYPKIDNLYGVGKSELFKNKLLGHFLRYHNVYPIDREAVDAKGLKKILKLMKENNKIKMVIFPEGKVLKDKSERGIVKNGAMYIAALSEVPIIPVYITARPKYFSKVIVKFGNPIYTDKKDSKNKAIIKEKSKELIEKIYEME